MIESFTVNTRTRIEMIDITSPVNKIVSSSGIKSGLCVVYVPHTTAAVTINENADRSVQHDMLNDLERLIPLSGRYEHLEGNSDAHMKASLLGQSETIIVEKEKLVLGIWQGIFFCEFDGGRTRKVCIKIIQD
jgi:secondary thiamine-phosphate synthase enzyme